MKSVIENHPVVIVCSVAIAAASVTAGVSTYLTSSYCNLERKQVEISKQKDIDDLQRRLLSIERKIGDKDSFFDVTALLISRNQMASLPKDIVAMGENEFFVSVPVDSNWKYERTSELGLMTDVLGKKFLAALPSDVSKALDVPVHWWSAGEAVVVNPRPKSALFAPDELTFRPYLAIETLSMDELKKKVGSIMTSMSSSEKVTKDVDALLDKLTQPTKGAVTKATAAEDEDLSVKKEVTETLDSVFRGDVVSVLLAGFVQSTLMFPQLYENTSASVVSAQKKGNVLYIKTEMSFTGTKIKDLPDTHDVVISMEFMAVTTAKRIVLVKIQEPSRDGGTGSYLWVEKMLAGLRIPFAA